MKVNYNVWVFNGLCEVNDLNNSVEKYSDLSPTKIKKEISQYLYKKLCKNTSDIATFNLTCYSKGKTYVVRPSLKTTDVKLNKSELSGCLFYVYRCDIGKMIENCDSVAIDYNGCSKPISIWMIDKLGLLNDDFKRNLYDIYTQGLVDGVKNLWFKFKTNKGNYCVYIDKTTLQKHKRLFDNPSICFTPRGEKKADIALSKNDDTMTDEMLDKLIDNDEKLRKERVKSFKPTIKQKNTQPFVKVSLSDLECGVDEQDNMDDCDQLPNNEYVDLKCDLAELYKRVLWVMGDEGVSIEDTENVRRIFKDQFDVDGIEETLAYQIFMKSMFRSDLRGNTMAEELFAMTASDFA